VLGKDILEIESAGTLSDAAGAKAGSWTVRCASVEGRAYVLVRVRVAFLCDASPYR
jgi:hypothetical protein